MGVSSKIVLRRSVHKFLQNFHYFTIVSAVLAFPFSLSILLSQTFVPLSSSLLYQIQNRLGTLFNAAGFPSSEFLKIFNLKISQTITSSIFTLPLTLTFLLIAKASIIDALKNHNNKPKFPPSFSSIILNYKSLCLTYIYNFFFIFSANATSFCFLFVASSFIEGLGFSVSSNFTPLVSAIAAILFSVILANALVICNMALTLSGMEGIGGFVAILKACVLLRGRTSMALFLALPFNAGLAAVEALFQIRVVNAFRVGGNGILWSFVAFDGIFIAFLHSVFIIMDTIVSCLFYQSCKMESRVDQEEKQKHSLGMEFQEEEDYGYLRFKNLEEVV